MTEQKLPGRRRATNAADAPLTAPASQSAPAAQTAPSGRRAARQAQAHTADRCAVSARPASLAEALAGAPAAPSGDAARRFTTSMRYGPSRPEARGAEARGRDAAAAADPRPAEAADQRPAEAAEPAADPAVVPFRPSPRRTAHHLAAAAAAVSGLVLAAAWPAGGAPEAEARVAHTTGPVADVKVAPSEDYTIARASVTSSYSDDDKMDHVLSAAGGNIGAIDTGGMLAQPLDTVRITSRFGHRPDPWGGGGTVPHIGQDYGVDCGTPVKAAAEGKVVQAAYAGHSGNRVRIDHGNGLQTTYNHNTSLKVAVGDRVKRGDVVALSGTTGNSTGCHLHFEVLIDGEAVDPAGWL